MYLDFDTTPHVVSRYVPPKTIAGAIQNAIRKIEQKGVEEGQVGIYENCRGEGFKGYVIKRRGEDPYFEPASAEDVAS